MHPLARVNPSDRPETHDSSGGGLPAERAAGLEPPLYGHAAAVHVLYQRDLVKQRTKPTPPRRPGGGKLVRALAAAVAVLRGLTPAEA